MSANSKKQKFIVGIDEVGRGALAGPVVLAAVRLSGPIRWTHPKLGRIRDCKQLTPKRRQAWSSYLSGHPNFRWRIARVGPAVIDRINIARAANLAAYRLVRRMVPDTTRCFAWLDGGLALPAAIPHCVLVKGDERKPLIAAASIIAKVWRDRMMRRQSRNFPAYGFETHKGYGTKAHRRALYGYGPSVIHRKTFLPA